MDTGRHFGVSVGDKAVLAIRLAARPSGTTMGEIRSHTGKNQYNVFKRLEQLGHKVRRVGVGANMQIWLRHRDGKKLPLDGTEVGSSINPANMHGAAASSTRLAAERHLQAAIRKNLAKIEPGLLQVDGGREHTFRDITAIDLKGNTVVIELKVVKTGMEAVAQLQYYMGELIASSGIRRSKVRGILIAPDFQQKAIFASMVSPNVKLLRYRLPLKFEPVA